MRKRNAAGSDDKGGWACYLILDDTQTLKRARKTAGVGDAKFVNLFRDGVDAVYSLIKAGIRPDLSEAAERWASSIVAIRVEKGAT